MDELSATPDERARKSHRIVLQRMQDPGRQVALATVLGVHESTVSRLKNDQLLTMCKILAHLGLKIVPVELELLDPDKVQAMLVFAKDALQRVETVSDLRWDEGDL